MIVVLIYILALATSTLNNGWVDGLILFFQFLFFYLIEHWEAKYSDLPLILEIFKKHPVLFMNVLKEQTEYCCCWRLNTHWLFEFLMICDMCFILYIVISVLVCREIRFGILAGHTPHSPDKAGPWTLPAYESDLTLH